jgi:polyhydroxyalkanoate synthesis regulator phasin
MRKSILMSVVLAAFVLVVGVVTAIADDNGSDDTGAAAVTTTTAASTETPATTVAPNENGRAETSDGTASVFQFGPLDEVLDEMVQSGALSPDLADEIRSRVTDKIEEQYGAGPGGFTFRFGPFTEDGTPPPLDPNRLRDSLTNPNGPLGDLPNLMQQFLEDGTLSPEERQQIQDQLQQQFQDRFGENSPFPFESTPAPGHPSI